jgi:hypothetical protein
LASLFLQTATGLSLSPEIVGVFLIAARRSIALVQASEKGWTSGRQHARTSLFRSIACVRRLRLDNLFGEMSAVRHRPRA